MSPVYNFFPCILFRIHWAARHHTREAMYYHLSTSYIASYDCAPFKSQDPLYVVGINLVTTLSKNTYTQQITTRQLAFPPTIKCSRPATYHQMDIIQWINEWMLTTLTVLPPPIVVVQLPDSHKPSTTIPRRFYYNSTSAFSVKSSGLAIR